MGVSDDTALVKAFEFVQDATKQLITLSAAIVALTITFYKDFATGASECSRNLMTVSWIFYLGCCVALFSFFSSLERLPARRNRNGSPRIATRGFPPVLSSSPSWPHLSLRCGRDGSPSTVHPSLLQIRRRIVPPPKIQAPYPQAQRSVLLCLQVPVHHLPQTPETDSERMAVRNRP
jgi:hypothetical protein